MMCSDWYAKRDYLMQILHCQKVELASEFLSLGIWCVFVRIIEVNCFRALQRKIDFLSHTPITDQRVYMGIENGNVIITVFCSTKAFLHDYLMKQ
jgi:hypothetical protein